MARNREVIKGLIRLADDVDEADNILKEEFSTVNERLAYLRGMFNIAIVARSEESIESDYLAILSAIVNQKWRS